jgi:hypothetical protein
MLAHPIITRSLNLSFRIGGSNCLLAEASACFSHASLFPVSMCTSAGLLQTQLCCCWLALPLDVAPPCRYWLARVGLYRCCTSSSELGPPLWPMQLLQLLGRLRSLFLRNFSLLRKAFQNITCVFCVHTGKVLQLYMLNIYVANDDMLF